MRAINIVVVNPATVMKNYIGVNGFEEHVQFLCNLCILSMLQSDLYANHKACRSMLLYINQNASSDMQADCANVIVLSFTL